MGRSPLSLVLFLFGTTLSISTEADYYWREYTGKIPADAVTGGTDINGDDVYIGQAYVKNEGLIVAQINPGNKEIYAPIKGAKLVDQHKILCGPAENFVWLPSNNTQLHLDLLRRQVVIGGHEDGLGSIAIGRISYEGGTQIGKINMFAVGNSWFRWVDKHKKEPAVASYETR